MKTCQRCERPYPPRVHDNGRCDNCNVSDSRSDARIAAKFDPKATPLLFEERERERESKRNALGIRKRMTP